MKKPFYKRWWFFLIVAIVIVAIVTPTSEEEPQVESKAESKKETKEEPKETNKESTDEERIENAIKDLVTDESAVGINEIKVVKNYGEDTDGGYNALVHLVFERQNKANTAKDAINAVTDKIGSKLAGTDKLENITFFWEVPYLHEGNNIIKINAEQRDGNMYRVDEWYDGGIFE